MALGILVGIWEKTDQLSEDRITLMKYSQSHSYLDHTSFTLQLTKGGKCTDRKRYSTCYQRNAGYNELPLYTY